MSKMQESSSVFFVSQMRKERKAVYVFLFT
jgi:hypothetical protein